VFRWRHLKGVLQEQVVSLLVSSFLTDMLDLARPCHLCSPVELLVELLVPLLEVPVLWLEDHSQA